MRRGLFGGTFDPPHVGHLMIAEVARETLALDAVDFIPAGMPPHKAHIRVSPVDDRIALVKKAVDTFPGFFVSLSEAMRAGPSFTVDTVMEYRREDPTDELFLLLGADMIVDFVHWKMAAEIARHAILVAAPRPHIVLGQAIAALKTHIVEAEVISLAMPELAISSSWIRRRLEKGLRVDPLLPSGIMDIIAQRGMYQGWPS